MNAKLRSWILVSSFFLFNSSFVFATWVAKDNATIDGLISSCPGTYSLTSQRCTEIGSTVKNTRCEKYDEAYGLLTTIGSTGEKNFAATLFQTGTCSGSTASGGGALTQSPVGNTLFVDAANGDDIQAVRGRADRPYKTPTAAWSAHQAGDTIRVLPGDYTITAALLTKSNVTVSGVGYASHISIADGTNPTGPMGVIENADTSGGNAGISVMNIRVDGANGTNTSGTQCGIRFNKVSKFTIENVYAEHFGRVGTASCIGISLQNATDGTVRGCIMDDVVDGINTGAGDTRLAIIGNVVVNTSRDYPINFVTCTNSVVSGNVLTTSGNSVGLAAINILGSNDNLIIGNIVNGSLGSGIKLRGAPGPVNNMVVGNTVRGCATYAIELTNNAGANNKILLNDVAGGGTTADMSIDAGPSGTVAQLNKQTTGTAAVVGGPLVGMGSYGEGTATPADGNTYRFFRRTDTNHLLVWTGSAWVQADN